MERVTTLRRTPSEEALTRLSLQAEACRACPLGFQRTQAVFGTGSAAADVMFVGEAPGVNEDSKGEPFVGAAGRLLTRLIETKLGLNRPDVYIANVLKCRPPGNRDPLPEEVRACASFLKSQLEVVEPKVVVTLGNFASKLLLRTDTGITRLRGKRYPFGGATLIPTFHPSAALRGSSAMNGITQDFEEIRRALDDLGTGQGPPQADPGEPDEAQPQTVSRLGPADAAARQLGLF
ncbi:MAG TPA: uracil-DNA glycosylase [Actinomycetota bacterium]|nr:uracil-DNA glycosylase [Actinomycetota bacterium]